MKRRFLLLLMFVALFAPWTAHAQFSGGNGSESNPYQISSSTDWNTLASNVSNGTNTADTYYKLTADISVTTSVGTNFEIYHGYSNNQFKGHFDGNGHTITVELTANNSHSGLFNVICYGASIKNLKVDGTIDGNGKDHIGGIVGCANTLSGGKVVTIENCWSNVTITNSNNYNSGIIAMCTSNGTLVVKGCIFTGKLLGEGNVGGGLFGHKQCNVTFQDCVFAPSEITMSTESSSNFGSGDPTLTNCYYNYGNYTFGTVQGTQAYKVTLAATPTVGGTVDGGTPTTDYGCFAKAYNNGIFCSGNGIYYANGNVSLNASPNSGYSFSKWNDNNTNNPRTISVSSNASYTAIFTEDGGQGGDTDGELTVYDGTDSNDHIPAYIFYFDDFTRSQFVIPSSTLTQMEGGTINAMKFYTTSNNVPYPASGTTQAPVDVYLMEVDYTTMTSFEPKTNGTIVYQGTLSVVAEGDGGAMTIEFDTPYTYGGGNLLVAIENTQDKDWQHMYFVGQTTDYNAAWSGSNGTSLADVSGSQVAFIPKTTFSFTPATAPSEDVVIGDGTSTGNYAPLVGNYKSSYDQMIYTKAQLQSVGITAGAHITKIGFNSNATNDYARNVVIYIGQTDKDAFSGNTDFVSFNSLTKVYDYSNHNQWSITPGWNEFELDTPFDYDGEDNLIIAVHCGLISNYASTNFYYTETSSTQVIYAYSDSKDPIPTSYDGNWGSYSGSKSTSKNLPNLKLSYTPTAGVPCPKPTNFDVVGNGTSATLTWESDASEWDVAHSTDGSANPDNNIVATASSTTYTLNNLAIDTDHYFWVRSNCSSTEQSKWTGPVSVHIGYCTPAPTSIDNSGITKVIFGTGANVVENGTHPSSSPYYANYTDQIGAVEAGVESSIAITYATGYTYWTYVWVDFDNSLSFDENEIICSGESTSSNPTTLTLNFTIPATVTPGDYRLRLGGADSGMNAGGNPCYSSTYGIFEDYTLRVLEANTCPAPTQWYMPTWSVKGNTAKATLSWGVEAGNTEEWQLCLNDGQQDHYYDVKVGYEDPNITEVSIQDAGTTVICTLINLTANTIYTAKVRTVCNEGIYSSCVEGSFTTTPKTFQDNGDFDGQWNNPNNWTPYGVPGVEDVVIDEEANISDGVVAKANDITIGENGSITIEDGGQLWHNNNDVELTIKRNITGYGHENASTNLGYQLFSSPVATEAEGAGLLNGTFNLYRFDSQANEEGPLEEWVVETSSIEPFMGYLYANEENTNITITGTVMGSSQSQTEDLVYNEGYRFGGWNLMGNPFVCNAYVSAGNNEEINYYVIEESDGRAEFVPANESNPIAPMGGLMVQATGEGQSITYSRTQPNKGSGILNMSVTKVLSNKGDALLDRARVRFGNGRNLEKFQLNPNHTKIYIPEDGKDYAVVYANGAGTIPVNFKAESNGRYNISFTTEEVGFNYLHLIDNRNGNDVDLLETPYYAFDAQSTDYASRFKLVFATGHNDGDDTFAFFNNGVWIINNPSTSSGAEATLQVVDVMGRVLSSETISGSCSKAINAAPGVYMLRLINGNDVKVQKVVVR